MSMRMYLLYTYETFSWSWNTLLSICCQTLHDKVQQEWRTESAKNNKHKNVGSSLHMYEMCHPSTIPLKTPILLCEKGYLTTCQKIKEISHMVLLVALLGTHSTPYCLIHIPGWKERVWESACVRVRQMIKRFGMARVPSYFQNRDGVCQCDWMKRDTCEVDKAMWATVDWWQKVMVVVIVDRVVVYIEWKPGTISIHTISAQRANTHTPPPFSFMSYRNNNDAIHLIFPCNVSIVLLPYLISHSTSHCWI